MTGNELDFPLALVAHSVHGRSDLVAPLGRTSEHVRRLPVSEE
jgi:hypothetical protein